MARFRRRNWPG